MCGGRLSAKDDRYNHSAKGRARAARYRLTAKRRAAQDRYNKSPKGRANWMRYFRRKGGWQKARQKPFGTAQFNLRAA